jgi:3-phenylpropionate/trans-cinnamate dioxygenase ferredoxin component
VAEVAVCAVADVPEGEARRFDVAGHRLAVVHAGGWHVIGDRCSHAEASLAEGEVLADSCEIECPRHGSTFSLVTGEPDSLPATRPQPVYPVRVDGDEVIVELP